MVNSLNLVSLVSIDMYQQTRGNLGKNYLDFYLHLNVDTIKGGEDWGEGQLQPLQRRE